MTPAPDPAAPATASDPETSGGRLRGLVGACRRLPLVGMAASLAFFGLFALPPLLVTVVWLGDHVVELGGLEGGVLHGVELILGTEARERVASIVLRAPRYDAGTWIASLFALGAFLIGAVAGVRHLQRSLDLVWSVERRRGVRSWLLRQVRQVASVLVILLAALLVLLMAGTGALVTTFPQSIADLLPGQLRVALLLVGEAVGVVLVLTPVLALLYAVVPDARVPWRGAWRGALLAAVLLALGRYPLAVYLQHTWRGHVFGAASATVGILLGIYAAAYALLVGGVASRVWSARPPAAP